jgi:tRNA (uracil-5-)-methyltransferase
MRDSLQNSTDEGTEEKHICIRDHKAIVRERVGLSLFEFPANSFFQNNNSVLVPLTDYVREAILSPPSGYIGKKPTYLVDTYCGSGLFAITLASSFERVVGIEISEVRPDSRGGDPDSHHVPHIH